MATKKLGEFVIDGHEKSPVLVRKLRLVPVGKGGVQLECNGVALFAFKSGSSVVGAFILGSNVDDLTGLQKYYGGKGRVRLDTDG